MIKRIEDKEPNLELHNVYTSKKLRSICFLVLDLLAKQENLPIKICQNCGRYFIPTFRQNEIYCDLENVDGSSTCREKGSYEILIKILLKENKIENDFLEICDLFENISSENLVIINNSVID